MRFAVLGAGSLGLLVGGYLARAGHQVVVVGKEQQVDLLKERGIEVVAPEGFRVPVETASRPDEVGPADYLLVVVKARDTVAALDRVAGVEFGAVLSLQNGMAKDGQLAERYGWPKVIGAATILGATLLEPGRTQHTMFGATYLGELDGSRSERAERLAAAFNGAGMKAEVPASILSAEWSKLCQIVPAALLSSASRLEYYRVCKSRDLAELFVEITHECAAVAAACGVRVEDYQGFPIRSIVDASREEAVETILTRGANLERSGQTSVRISMLQDILKGRKTEIEETAGYVVQRAREQGIAVPDVEFGYRLVRGVEAYL
ncbi:MAG: ketopantoate reductase family protein [Chloroflexi bacterium]|nr:ketopantoate reductase family protein [Chloroflexota bacterium]